MGAALGTKRRVPRRGADTRAVQLAAAEKMIAAANKLTNEEFTDEYIKPSDESWPTWTHPKTAAKYSMSLRSPEDMSDAELEACYDIVENTSGKDYRGASVGWHPEAKRAEMRSAGLRYILVKRTRDARGDDGDHAEAVNEGIRRDETGPGGDIRAFTSFMPTFEDNQPVIYCYEIHLLPDMAKTGLGKLLMGHVTAAADRIETLEKTMLTCFVSNAHARRFYENLGFDVDESSPRPRRLRRDKVIEPEYVILYKRTKRGGGDDGDAEAQGQEGEGEKHKEKRVKT
ncbi:hypothetical protein NLG97_g6106 [Lecanicillium saksenae]|uniref:Uncharacterized protein n=1 Tax=Lecanicillium saksenae TaxID=468837 RepID=A0ACC1QT54_9HYPO|nr:hypothetical protein NLG97_g6106 [Lecanicillium saksenae]